MLGVVVATVGPMGGQVRLANGETWTARTATAIEITPGVAVTVTLIDGATAVVQPVEPPQEIQEEFPA
jgi:membrane protein implicated in regulation of membrane protease activity